MSGQIPERVRRELISFAKKHHIRKLALFGSRARGTHGDRSDIDLAVPGGDFDAFYWDVKENIHSLLSFDLIDMDAGISEDLAAETKKDGLALYEEA